MLSYDGKKDHEIQLMARKASLADQATLTDVELAQEEEVRVLTERWDANYPDIQHQATQEKCRTVDILNNEIKGLEKDGVPIPADAAILAHKKIYFKNDRKKDIRATNMVALSPSDLHLVSLSLNRSIHAQFIGFKDLYDQGSAIADYAVDSTQRPSQRDPRLRARKYIARLPLSMTAARVIPEDKDTFKMTEVDHDKSSNNGVFNIDENQPIPLSTAKVFEWKEGMTPYRGGLQFSRKNIDQGEYTLQALNNYAAEWTISVERLLVTACTDKIKGSGITPKTLTWSSLSIDDLLKIALTYTFTDKDYMITTVAISEETTYIKYAKIDRSKTVQDASESDMGAAAGRDNFQSAANRDVFAHPDGNIGTDKALGWDASETINVHMLGMNPTSAMEETKNPAMVCFFWGLEAGTAFERQNGDPRVLFQ